MRAYSCRLGPSLADCATGRGNMRGESCTSLPACNSRGSIGSTHNGEQDEVTGKLVVSLLAQPGLGYLRCATVLRKQARTGGGVSSTISQMRGLQQGAFRRSAHALSCAKLRRAGRLQVEPPAREQTDPVVEVADDAPIPETELWREIKLIAVLGNARGAEVSPKDLLRRGIHFCIRGAYSAS
jgi:hypothetical protein